MTLPLEGVTVLDLAYYLPAAYCTQMLGDMGADVVKIDEPAGPGPRRPGAGVSPAAGKEGEGVAAHNFFNRNKRSIILNLKSAEAVKVFHALARRADVVVENMRPGVVKRLGIDYETLKEINPRIVYCSISGYGQDGPYRLTAGHDPNYCSIAGAQGLNLDREKKPVNFGVPLADIGSSLHAIIGILLALAAREKTGMGQFVDISMTDSVLSFVSRHLRECLRPGLWPLKGLIGAAISVHEAKDGKFFTTANVEPYFWERFCKVIGREDLAAYQYAKGEKAKEVCSTIRQVLLTKTRDEWVKELTEADTCVAPVLELDEVPSDPQVTHRQMIIELDHPTLGKIKQLGFPVKLSDTPGQVRCFAPVAGQQTGEIVQGLGYTREQVEQLRQSGAIQ